MTNIRRTAITMPPVMLANLKQEALDRDMTLSQLIRFYVRSGQLRDPGAAPDLQREGITNDNG